MMASGLQVNCAGDMEWSRQKCVKMVWMLYGKEQFINVYHSLLFLHC